ncbi:hypothetical protein LCGC14_2901000, partial [marine sediment metagenome]
LGQVPYARAYREARAVFNQYFSIASADEESGKIVGRPRATETAPDRLLGVSPARHIAQMRVREKGGQVIVEVRVDIQRQDVGAYRAMQPITVDNDVPIRTPAEESGAVTAGQNQAWTTTGRDEALERTLLSDLLQRLATKP